MDKEQLNKAAEYIRKYMKDNPIIKDLAPMYEKCNRDDRMYLSQALMGIEPWEYMSHIPAFSFHKCEVPTKIDLPIGITSIGGFAFYECNSLASITIPDSVTRIRRYALYNCGSLTSITIGNGITRIGDSAFERCMSLNHIKFNGTIAQWESVSIEEDTFIDVPVEKITCSDGITNLIH